MNNSLYQISQSLIEIEKTLIENEGEVTDSIEDALEKLSSELQLKTDGVTEYIKSLEAMRDLAKQRENEFKDLKKKVENKLSRFNEYVVNCMDRLNTTKLEGQYSAISIRKPAQVLEIVDEKEVPMEFVRVDKIYNIDKVTLKNELKSGKEIAGARLKMGARKASFKI